MKQTITLKIDFSDTSYKLRIMDVYKSDNNLIVLTHINSVGAGGEAITPRSVHTTIENGSDRLLPVKYYALVSENLKSKRSFLLDSRDIMVVVPSVERIFELRDPAKCQILERVDHELIDHSEESEEEEENYGSYFQP